MTEKYDSAVSHCAACPYMKPDRICKKENKASAKHPPTCPTAGADDLLARALAEYESNPEIARFARQAVIQEGSGYEEVPGMPGAVRPLKTRIQEVCEFCERMDYRHLGLAFCMGLADEARILNKILEARGFEVTSVICKVGGEPKESIVIEPEGKILPDRFESMCNPIAQAMLLNDAHTEFNLLLGLCVGHDSLVIKYSEAMCTVVAVKDRLLGNNPLGAIYSGYYKYLQSWKGEPVDLPGTK